jgi:mono/diheme cytochrome c family protein
VVKISLASGAATRFSAMVYAVAMLTANTASAQPGGTFVPREEAPEEFAAGPGRDEAFYACTACHNFKLVASQGMSRERWDDTIRLMIDRHNMPAIDGEDRRRVLDYLAQAYPPRAPSRQGGWQNPFTR